MSNKTCGIPDACICGMCTPPAQQHSAPELPTEVERSSGRPPVMPPVGGWICGKCGLSNAPFVSTCSCSFSAPELPTDNQDWRCEECDKTLKGKAGLDMHNKDKHGIPIPRIEDDGYMTEADYQTWGRL